MRLSGLVRSVACIAGALLVSAGAAHAQQEFANNAPIIINDAAPASPYPAQVLVTGLKRPVGRVTVQLRNLSHTFDADIAMVLVSPSGRAVSLVSRCGNGAGIVNATLNFDDDALSTVPNPIVTGTYRPSSCFAVTFAPPAPTNGFGNALSTFNGDNPNGVWSLYVQDFAGADIGQIAGGFSIYITEAGEGSQVFRNTAPITIRDVNTALPYPSAIVVSGLNNPIASVAVRLHDFNHTFPNDVGMLLVGPNGQRVTLMEARGGGADAVHLELGFADTGANPPNVWSSGTFRASNDNPAYNFTPPAPAGPYSTSFSSFAGANANGTWSLYVTDQVGIDVGTIAGGWDLIIYQGDSCPADFNNDGIVNSQDYFDFLTAFFNGC